MYFHFGRMIFGGGGRVPFWRLFLLLIHFLDLDLDLRMMVMIDRGVGGGGGCTCGYVHLGSCGFE